MSRWSRAHALSVLAGSALLFATPLSAQEYPSRYVRIITGGAGSFHDIVARQLAQRLSERWGQSVVIENQPAAGLTIGSGIAAKAAPDGYTLLLADRTALAAAPHLYRSLRYDPVKDFRPITLVARAPNVLVTHAGPGLANLREFVDDARRQPQPILFAGAGVGTSAHLAGELFRQLAKIDMQIVQYRGGTDAALAVLKSEAKLTCVPISVALPHIEAGKMRALVVASGQRFAGAPDVPTSAEGGLQGFEAEQWLAMVAPMGLPDAIADKLNRDIVDVLRKPEFGALVRAQGGEVASGTPAELAAFIAKETARLKQLIDAVGVRME
jgi:tripartite-type tricarboxylate transporter receptor subunit TctC